MVPADPVGARAWGDAMGTLERLGQHKGISRQEVIAKERERRTTRGS